ncbi:MAG: AmmeMemoRadiSam system radical SAM enzyme, partial [Deltaproteobacteria bacterium]|nr:AmmeMemoRadiSam system radical SAM enzyme [Deltaproteobacteria bacterium]
MLGKPARFWKKTDKGFALCGLCHRKCLFREDHQRGYCQVRGYEDGALQTFNYGYDRAMNLDPVEKKPLYHFRPGTKTFSIGAPGCDFNCLGCQNHKLARPGPDYPGPYDAADAASLVEIARRVGADSFSFTYSEPTVFYEYADDIGRLAKTRGYASIWVTNGYFSDEVLESLDYVAAMNIDLKGFTKKFYNEVTDAWLEPVKDNIERVHQKGIWLEVTTLVIPTLNDGDEDLEKMAAFISGLSPDIPWHLSRFMPLHNQSHLPMTPEKTLLRARDIGKGAGLKYVYLG